MNGYLYFYSIIKDIENITYHHFFDISDYNTYKIKTIVEHFIIPKNIYALKKAIILLHELELPYVIIGNGSKILFKDKYVKKVVISLKDYLNEIAYCDGKIYVNAGVNLQKLISYALKYNLGGLEKLIAIPASVGGAIYNNCGAHEVEIGEYVEKVECFDSTGEFVSFSKSECNFKYRSSVFKKLKKYTIINVLFNFNPVDVQIANNKIKEALLYRSKHQPLNKKNCGSIFKNTDSYKAYELIKKANLVGMKRNGAMISKEHANFIINQGKATASDIIYLINHIIQEVEQKFGIKLELELEII